MISPSAAGGLILLFYIVTGVTVIWMAALFALRFYANRSETGEKIPPLEMSDANIGVFIGLVVFGVTLLFNMGNLRNFLVGVYYDNPRLHFVSTILAEGKAAGSAGQLGRSASQGAIDPAFGSSSSQGGQALETGASVETRLDITGLTEANEGFVFTRIYVDIANNGTSSERNPILRCWQLGQNGTTISQDDETIYQDVIPGETISYNFSIYRDNQTVDIQCQVVSSVGF